MIGFITRTLAMAVFILAGTESHAATECEVDVYRAYNIAVSRGWKFNCIDATFVPMAATRALSCRGKAREGNHAVGIRFFGHPVRSSELDNGWRIADAEFEGVRVKKIRSPEFRLAANGILSAPNREFRVVLKKLRLKKHQGNCADIYEQAF